MPDSTEPTSQEGRGLGHHPAFTQVAGLHGGGEGTGPALRPGPDAGPLLWCEGAMDWVGGLLWLPATPRVFLRVTVRVCLRITLRVLLRVTPKVFLSITLSPWLGPFCSNHELWKLCPTHSFKELDP